MYCLIDVLKELLKSIECRLVESWADLVSMTKQMIGRSAVIEVAADCLCQTLDTGGL
jgi:hypothetical protein